MLCLIVNHISQADFETDGVHIKPENPKYSKMMQALYVLMKRIKVLNRDLPDAKKAFATFKASKKTVEGIDIAQLQNGLTKCAEFIDQVEDLHAVCKAISVNEEDSIIDSKMTEISVFEVEANGFIGAIKVAKQALFENKPK